MGMEHYPYGGRGFEDWPADRVSGYSSEFLVNLFYQMLRIRMIEEEIEAQYDQDHMKTPIHLVIGQEAGSVGVCAALRTADGIYSSHRTHGNYLAKGGDLKAMLAELHCRANGCTASRGGSMHLLDKQAGMDGASAIVAGAAPMAAGAAMAAQMMGEDRVMVVFFGDAAIEEGALWETFNFAVLKRLPIVFVCENNFYSVCTPLSARQPAGIEIVHKAAAFGLVSNRVDGVNVLEVYQAANQAVARARQGEGPSFLEIQAYRWRSHHGAGDDSDTGYRSPDEGATWHRFCPVTTYGTWLSRHGLLRAEDETAMRQRIREEIAEGFQHALASPLPTADDLATFVYAD